MKTINLRATTIRGSVSLTTDAVTIAELKSAIRTNGLELLLKEHKEIEQRTKEIFDDSLEQLIFFKRDFIHKYGRHINGNIELQNMMNEIYDIEEYIVSKQDEYKKENESIKIKLKRY